MAGMFNLPVEKKGFIPGELKFEAYCTQSGSDSPDTYTIGNPFVVGKSYKIHDYINGDDFTNIGASSNASGVFFIATGTTPANWTNSTQIRFDSGPFTIIIENNLNVHGWEYQGDGQYWLYSDAAFTENKTFVTFGGLNWTQGNVPSIQWSWLDSNTIEINTKRDGSQVNNMFNSYFKVVVLP